MGCRRLRLPREDTTDADTKGVTRSAPAGAMVAAAAGHPVFGSFTLPDLQHDLVTTVEEALRLHADAVSVHVNLGSNSEARQISALARAAEACDAWRMPLLAMVYLRGPRIEHSDDPALLAHAAILASDLGADLVKIPFARSSAEMADVVASCPIPVLAAGGSR